jgi:cytochrome c2
MSHDERLGIEHPIRPEPGAHNQRDDVDASGIFIVGITMSLVVLVTVLYISAYYHHYRHELYFQRMSTVGNWAAAVKQEQVAQIEPHYANAAHTKATIGIQLAMDEVVKQYQAYAHPKPVSKTTESTHAAAAGPIRPKGPLSVYGKKLYASLGCIACHTVDGSPGVGPTWKNLAGYPVTLTTGKTVTADYKYLRTMVLYPGKLVVKGFPNIMPNYAGKLGGKKNIYKLNAIIWYINKLSNKSSKTTQPPMPNG